MKNIHVLPTDKPSRFSLNSSGKYHLTNQLHTNSPNFTNQHIYITSDEEIKTLEYEIYYDKILKKVGGDASYGKKIILTTDQDLIKDGVQSIDDEFLEWFVKNPSCEGVDIYCKLTVKENVIQELMKHEYYKKYPEELPNCVFINHYKIIIPKEEPKKETIEDAMRQNGYHDKPSDDLWREGVDFGAKWHAERSYSEEEVFFFLREALYDTDMRYNRISVEEWFEQFKKK